MAKVEVKITEAAFKDIDQIEKYYSESSAKKQIKVIYKKFDDLEKQPLSGRPVPELADENIRQVKAGNYRIIYHVITHYFLMVLRVFSYKRKFNPDDDLDFNQ